MSGRPKSHAKSRTTTAIRFPPEMHERLWKEAEGRDLSINFLVVKAVGEFLERLIPVDDMRWTRDREK